MKKTIISPALAIFLATGMSVAAAQNNVIKVGVTRYDTHSVTNGISGIGVPPGADAETGDASTVIVVYERLLTPNIGIEFAIGYPPTIKARATGSVAFLGEVLSAKTLAPTVFVTYHFGSPGDVWRPNFGAGINYTHFTRVRSKLANDVNLGDSVGFAMQIGASYALGQNWDLVGSIARLDVKSKLVASGAAVLTSTIDLRPWAYSIGVSHGF